MLAQEVGHGADGVNGVADQVDVRVTVEVDGVLPPTGGHELAITHGAGEAALEVGWAAAFCFGQLQERTEFALKVGASITALPREVKGQGGKSIEDAVVAHDLAVICLHAQDAHDQGGGNAELGLGTRQRVGVLGPKAQASLQAHGFDEAVAVGSPVLRHPCGRGHHQLSRSALITGLLQCIL